VNLVVKRGVVSQICLELSIILSSSFSEHAMKVGYDAFECLHRWSSRIITSVDISASRPEFEIYTFCETIKHTYSKIYEDDIVIE
jgi:hypothetical protein